MEFLAQEVLIEAISKLAALSHSKLFLLMEDSLSNRSYAGAESLCTAFAEGSLRKRENDAKVEYDVNERRCVKAVRQVWQKEGSDGGGGGGAAGKEGGGVGNGREMGSYPSIAERVMNRASDPIDQRDSTDEVLGREQVEPEPVALDGGRGGAEEISSDDFPLQLATLGSMAAPEVGGVPPKRGFAESRSDIGIAKRIKTEPKSRSPSPPIQEATLPQLPALDTNLLQSALRDDNLMSSISSALKSLSHLPSVVASSSPSVSLPTVARDGSPTVAAASPTRFAAPRSDAASRGRSPRLGGGGGGGGGEGSAGAAGDKQHSDDTQQSPSVSLFPDALPPPSSPHPRSTSHPRSASSSPSRAPLPSPSSSSCTVSPFASDATRTIRVNSANYSDVDSVSARFRRFGEVLHVARDRPTSSPTSSWWTIEFGSVRAAAEALSFVRDQRGLEASFDANSEFTDWIWVAFQHPDVAAAAAKDPSSLDRVVVSFLKAQFAIFGTILKTSEVKFAENVREASCVIQFRSTKHVEMIIQKVRGQQLSGTRFQLDVASPLLKNRYFEVGSGGGGGIGAGGSGGGGGDTSMSGNSGDKSGRSSGSRSSEPRISGSQQQQQQLQQQQPEARLQNSAEQPTRRRAEEVERIDGAAGESSLAASRERPQQRQPADDERSRTIKLVLSEKQLSILKQCPVEKLISLFSSYGDVVEVFMPTEAHPDFAVEFLDVEAAKNAIVAGRASSGAFQAVFDVGGERGGVVDTVWMGSLDMPPASSGTTASAIRRELLDKFVDFDSRPKSIWIARSKSQSVIRFSSPEVAQRVLAALNEERRSGKSSKKIDFDGISPKAVKMFVEKLSEEDRVENYKSK